MKTLITSIEAELVLDCLDFDILIISSDFKILFANKSFLKKIECNKDKVIGQYCYKISYHLNSQCKPPLDPCPIDTVIATGNPAVKVHTHLTKDNQKVLVSVTAAAIKEVGEDICYLHISLPSIPGVSNEDNINMALEKTLSVLDVVALYQRQMKEIKEKSEVLEKTKAVLESKVRDLEIFHKASVGRELKMVELKKKIEELEGKLQK